MIVKCDYKDSPEILRDFIINNVTKSNSNYRKNIFYIYKGNKCFINKNQVCKALGMNQYIFDKSIKDKECETLIKYELTYTPEIVNKVIDKYFRHISSDEDIDKYIKIEQND